MSLSVLRGWAGAGLQLLLTPHSDSSSATQALALSSSCLSSAASCLPALRGRVQCFSAQLILPGWAACPLQSCKHTCGLLPLCLFSGKPLCEGCIRLRAPVPLLSIAFASQQDGQLPFSRPPPPSGFAALPSPFPLSGLFPATTFRSRIIICIPFLWPEAHRPLCWREGSVSISAALSG